MNGFLPLAATVGLAFLATASGCEEPECRMYYCVFGDNFGGGDPRPLCREPDPDDLVTSGPIPISGISIADVGHNIDGINNAPRGGIGGGLGRTIPGCDIADSPSGHDLEFAAAANELLATVDLNGPLEFRDTVVGDAIATEFRILDLTAPDQATDGCAEIELRFGELDDRSIAGSGSLIERHTAIQFDVHFDLVLRPTPAATSCDGPCVPASIRIRLDQPYAKLIFDESNSGFVAPSTISGAIFYADDTISDPSLNDTGLRSELERYADAAHLTTDARDALLATFEKHLDLHMSPDRRITTCTAPDGNAALVNSNAISLALALR